MPHHRAFARWRRAPDPKKIRLNDNEMPATPRRSSARMSQPPTLLLRRAVAPLRADRVIVRRPAD